MYARTYVCIYACMYVCMYVCTYACMYVCMYVRTYVCMHACTYVCMYECTYVYMHVCIYVCIYACMYVYMYVRISIWITGTTNLSTTHISLMTDLHEVTSYINTILISSQYSLYLNAVGTRRLHMLFLQCFKKWVHFISRCIHLIKILWNETYSRLIALYKQVEQVCLWNGRK
jgi:hypothetical protein